MNLPDKIKIDDSVMKSLHVNEVRRLICDTDKGKLNLVIRKGETKYFLTLDAVPVDKETNKELMELLFPLKSISYQGKEYQTTGKQSVITVASPRTGAAIEVAIVDDTNNPNVAQPVLVKNKGGRPVAKKVIK